ncbi:hypothetical protein [Salinibacter grassmerensis]|uniref:hypothetical protein n=1 Tax=Salinibacter grassmerensis TaxID=3040353 RepID=UPI0021E72586|nr:hypothetical protein [Salinibacter grassmerensis]
MLTELGIAAGLLVAIGVVFIVLRGSSSLNSVGRRRTTQHGRERRDRAAEADSSEDDGGPPASETISQWSDSL